MTLRRYRHLSSREELYKRLEEIMKARGFNSVADTIAYLLTLEEGLKEV